MQRAAYQMQKDSFNLMMLIPAWKSRWGFFKAESSKFQQQKERGNFQR